MSIPFDGDLQNWFRFRHLNLILIKGEDAGVVVVEDHDGRDELGAEPHGFEL